jgi:glycosyltransferase involved in cell wall biosynthesis
MKLVIVNAHVSQKIGGSEMQCHLIAQELHRRGHDVHFVAVGGAQSAPDISYHVQSVAASAKQIAAACIAIRPDVVYWRFNKRNFYTAAKLIARANIPIVFAISHVADTQRWASKRVSSGSDWRDLYRILRDRILSRWNYQGFRFVAGIVANNADHLNLIPLDPQLHVPNIVGELPENPGEPSQWPRPYCLWVASIKQQKQPEKFIELADRLGGLGIDFLMIGKVDSPKYAHIVNGLRLPRSFHYLGAKDARAVNRFVKGALFVVHTCRPEGFPNIFIEAWSQAKPVVSLCFDPEGLLRRENIGICSGDFEQFVKDVTSLIGDSGLREEMGRRARAFADQSFNLERNVGTLEAFLQRTARDTSRRA